MHSESARLFVTLNNQTGIATALEAFGALAAAQGKMAHAALCFGAAGAVMRVLDGTLSPFLRSAHEELVTATRSALGETAFAAAWAAGSALARTEAIALATTNFV